MSAARGSLLTGGSPEVRLVQILPTANFFSFFAIAVIEFAVPFLAVTSNGASSAVIAVLALCRFGPQVLLASWIGRLVNARSPRSLLLAAEALRGVAFLFAATAFAFNVADVFSLAVFAIANLLLAVASAITAVATQVLVPLVVSAPALPRTYSRLSVAESAADAAGPFLAGLSLAHLSESRTFGFCIAIAALSTLLLSRLPPVNAVAPNSTDGTNQAPPGDKSSFASGLALNFRTGGLSAITLWAVSYNLGQSVIEAVIVIALLESTPLSVALYGILRTAAVVFAVFGALLADRLPRFLMSGAGIGVFGFLAIASYGVVAVGLAVGGTAGLAIVAAGFALDEFASGVVIVLMQVYRARSFSAAERGPATASYRALNIGAVPVGFAIGGAAGLLVAGSTVVTIAGPFLLLPGIALLCSRDLRRHGSLTAP